MKNIKLVHERRDEWDRSHFELWAAQLREKDILVTHSPWAGWHQEDEDSAQNG
ncbi:hypothetical protein [Paenarthrobacter nitroguajacolicus]|uniref:hypothetical protein n=1 Tax=Paenarthrobacter nitroguajacolicus TaxID=211146 RepID=UPI00248CE5A0|nr:hypothetical protein [Paenarthrobacter nitroguajacolicus]MDI2036010.1 hypothetical protein [Paenarthrobacter nitroguajacolicus]